MSKKRKYGIFVTIDAFIFSSWLFYSFAYSDTISLLIAIIFMVLFIVDWYKLWEKDD